MGEGENKLNKINIDINVTFKYKLEHDLMHSANFPSLHPKFSREPSLILNDPHSRSVSCFPLIDLPDCAESVPKKSG